MKVDRIHRQTVLGLLILVSLGANVLLAIYITKRDDSSPRRPRYVRTESTDQSAVNLVPAGPVGTPDLRPRSDLIGMVSSWRQAGANESIVRSLAIALVQDRFAQQIAELMYPPGAPFWRQGSVNRSQVAHIEREKAALLAEILGEQVEMVTAEERAIQRQIYGDLPQEKIDRILEVSSRHRELARHVDSNDPQRSVKLSALRSEFDRELSTFLSPTEFQEYLRQSKLNETRTVAP